MFLAELELENVRAIDHLQMSFVSETSETRKCTVFIGENGCGKSTILKAVALLMAGSEGISELIGSPDSWIRLGQKSCRFRAKLITAQNEPRNVEFTLRRKDELRTSSRGTVFGLPTLDSKEVQVKKDALRELKRKGTPKTSVRLRSLKKDLSDMPDWSLYSFTDEKELALLRDIRKELSGSNGHSVKAKRKKARV